MVTRDSAEREEQRTDDDLTFTRRTALGLLGVGGASAMLSGSATASHDGADTDEVRPWNQHVDAQTHDLRNLHAIDVGHVHTAARDADVVVWKDEDGVFHADSADEQVASGDDVIDVTQAAVDSLTEGRDWKEKVAVVSPGTVGPVDEMHAVNVPSYTVLDYLAPITIEDEGEAWVIPVRARNAHHVEVPNLTIRGTARYGIIMNSVSNVSLGNVEMEMDGGGFGIRIDDSGSDGRSSDVQVDRIYAENVDNHVFETRGVDRVQVNQVLAKNVSGCTVLFNESSDATVNSIVEYSPDPPNESRYATFRTTYQQGRVAVGNIVSHDAKRGLHLHTGSGELVIGNVYVEGARNRGAVLSGPPNAVLNGGVIKNVTGKAIDLYTISDPTREPERAADGVVISNFRITDDRPEEDRDQTHAIHETGNAMNNRIVNNDVRDGGTEALLEIDTETSVIRDNVGDGVDSGTVTLESGAEPAARVEGVSQNRDVTLDLRAKTFEGPSASFAWDHYFEYDGEAEQWDLIVEWRTDPGEDVELDYIIDRPQANLGRYPGEPSFDGPDDAIQGPVEEGRYRLAAVHSEYSLTVEGASTGSGSNVVQDEWGGADHQRWDVVELDEYDGQFRLESVDTGLVLEVEDGSEENGANVQVGEWTGDAHQRFTVEEEHLGEYAVRAVHSDQGLNVEGSSGAPGANVLQWPFGGDQNELWMFVEE
ncbi:RICIN domain-containing protein [Halobacteria archaeon AArc-m2/3/4]|uniref:RICIN domain-containing protein n=1 Tax=Natronoglomus mannanivorans TaxID=2979990 RepID=A0ABT2QF53_9EURY|nr:RICIN domain-containing protein [Halobacteria archaeon AArc-m2/3/4]